MPFSGDTLRRFSARFISSCVYWHSHVAISRRLHVGIYFVVSNHQDSVENGIDFVIEEVGLPRE